MPLWHGFCGCGSASCDTPISPQSQCDASCGRGFSAAAVITERCGKVLCFMRDGVAVRVNFLPRLSTDSSLSSYDAVLADYCSLSIEHSDNERPVSTVSTVSSGSSGEGQSNLFTASQCPQSLSSLSTETYINLELSPPEMPDEHPLPLMPASKISRQDPTAGQFNNNASSVKDITLPPILDGSSPLATTVMAPNSQITYVDRVVMEIIETERMYVKDLRSIVEGTDITKIEQLEMSKIFLIVPPLQTLNYYLAHIIDTRNLPVKPEQVCSLFGNIEVIYEFNSELLQSLEMCDSDPVAIAWCFVEKSEYFDIYTKYCTNYPNSVATLTDCMRNKTLAKFFRDRQASLQHSLPLALFTEAIYAALSIQEIAKHFDPEENGYDVVEEAIVTMTGVAWYINDMKRKHEHAVRLQEIQSLLINWKGPDLTMYGELVLEGTFHVHRAKNERTLFLFDKVLIITKKRGEHYVYKTHIMCSTLMLIESAKDSLRFSVTHYKHPKQPHTMRAKTVEEKKLWAHHIKRLILENHHAIIPQKAKDAILDMRPDCPVKYRYSPDRHNKSDDLLIAGLKERRRSEPFNRVKQNMRTTKETLKHSDSIGTLLSSSSQRYLHAAASVSTGKAETEMPSTQERMSGWLSLDWLSTNSLETCQLEMPFLTETEKEWALENVQPQKKDDDKIMVKDEQKRDGEQAMEETELVKPGRSQSPSAEDQTAISAFCEQDSSEDQCSHAITLPGNTEEEEEGQRQSHITSQDQDRKSEEMEVERVASLSVVHSDIQLDDKSTQSSNKPLEDVEDLEEDEEEDEEEEDVSRNEPRSILPVSVLDKASVIVECFTRSHSRQSSLPTDDMFSFGCPSSQMGSRRNSVFSLNAEPLDKEKCQEQNCSSPNPATFKIISESLTSVIPGPHMLTPDQRPQTKPDTLSKKDRMLIHKIKNYYDHAEQQDANFSIKRRESLSYIPAGLVRNLSQQLNGHPAKEDAANRMKATKIARPTSWTVFDLPGLEKQKKSEEVLDTEIPSMLDKKVMDRSPVVAQKGGKDKDFRFSSEVMRVWQDMEVEISGASKEVQGSSKDKINGAVANPQDQKGQNSSCSSSDLGKHMLILEEFDNSKDGQGGSTPSTLSSSLYSDQETQKIRHASRPKVVSLRSDSEEDQMLQDMDNMKNKVFHLARQYSQRIKNSGPVVRQRVKVAESNFVHRKLSFVMEDKSPEMGMQGLVLSSCEHTDSSSSPSPCSVGSPQPQSTLRPPALEPQSPVYTESFNWPDVRELRSKYSRPNPQIISINRSCSVPERIPEPIPLTQQTNCTEIPGKYYISGQAILPNKKKVIIMERIKKTENDDLTAAEEAKEELHVDHPGCLDSDKTQRLNSFEKTENSQYGLVKNLREKFQNLSSFT
ncbi:Pleckstrin homology domain-containing family G member 3 [Bagarius yarrelli]|uniref:Pleckstrin homology domain-containing family G member 3 n=1 Tax=Bagarius yarrelli TaxID=175774 RepID=A0A556VA56_BAGYA|nr:Pleckstrin homology domain-containing family G member 3 [Bagarius yarrelli]